MLLSTAVQADDHTYALITIGLHTRNAKASSPSWSTKLCHCFDTGNSNLIRDYMDVRDNEHEIYLLFRNCALNLIQNLVNCLDAFRHFAKPTCNLQDLGIIEHVVLVCAWYLFKRRVAPCIYI